MANPIKGELTEHIDGADFTFILDSNALVELEDYMGSTWPGGAKRVTTADLVPLVGTGDIKTLRAFLWAACRRKHEDVTLADAGELVDALGPPKASAMILDLMARAFPKPEVGKAKARPRKGAKGTATTDGTSNAS